MNHQTRLQYVVFIISKKNETKAKENESHKRKEKKKLKQSKVPLLTLLTTTTMGKFSTSPRNVKHHKVGITTMPFTPWLYGEGAEGDHYPHQHHHDQHHGHDHTNKQHHHYTNAHTCPAKDELMYHALLKMKTRKIFRAAVYAIIFTNVLLERVESKKKTLRKLRASVRCINFLQLLEERQAARRKFRASIDAVELANSLGIAIEVRKKFRAAVTVVILSNRVVDPPLHETFTLRTFQDVVNLMIAVNKLQEPFTATTTIQEDHQAMIHDIGMKHFNEAIDKALHKSPKEYRHDVLEKKKKKTHTTAPKDSDDDWDCDFLIPGEEYEVEWEPTVIHGSLVHASQDLTTLWKFVEKEDSQDCDKKKK